MLAAGGGSIVNNAPVAGVGADPLIHAYHAAKHGAVGLTKSVALEVAQQNIRVNALITGVIDTPLYREGIAADPGLADHLHGRIPMGRAGTEEEIANFTAFLLSDEVAYITGAALAIDGGITAR
jgi:NAD(P)-dependent dehydrogenase (short-subunit alcohol dehydrogenase family)